MPAPPEIVELCERFEYNSAAYRSDKYNETQVRREFLDPFFKALGWDIDNNQGFAEAYKDVVHEDAIKISGTTNAPDYCFRIGGARKFFLEAKKPSVNVKDDVKPAFQLRRYAWSAKLPLSIVSDFEEFAVYDCRVQPQETDKPATARIMYLTYKDYVEKWDDIAAIFSKNAILKGAFDKYAETKHRRGTAEVDAAFLKEIETWRERLAQNVALHNPSISSRDLNFVIQIIIDRIIFLRICEDRGIEDLGRLQSLLKKKGLYPRLVEQFRDADERYNSGLFHLHTEKDRSNEGLDSITPNLKIDDTILRDIIESLYDPAPYAFEVFPADILGQVYERFLARVIRRDGQTVIIEEKPDLKKAEGVYYTPTAVVNYIVQETAGKLLDGKTTRQAEKIKILDPACGSGSFLIAAYQRLLDWHLDWYMSESPAKYAKGNNPRVYQGAAGAWRLTTGERKRILLANIYGVDIDPQAVEVTKLSLLLKVLEGETHETVKSQLMFSLGRVLPDLDGNIKCGNSLIGPDFYDQQKLELLTEDDMFRVNVFDWNSAFPTIMKEGGFDVVLGNPPYLNIDDTWGKGDLRQRYIKRAYPFIYNDKTDILFYFLAKAVQLSKGEIGYIVSRAFLEAFKADKLRQWLAEHSDIHEIIDFRNHYIFERVGITTAILLLNTRKQIKTKHAVTYQLKVNSFVPLDLAAQKQDSNLFVSISTPQKAFTSAPWSFADSSDEKIIQKIDGNGSPLSTLLTIGQGMQTGCNDVFGNLPLDVIEEWKLETGQYYVRARNSDIQRFQIHNSGELLIYPERADRFAELPLRLREHLKSNEAKLKQRAAYIRGNCEWWRYTWPLHKDYMSRPKLYCPYMATENRFALDEDGKYLGLTDTTVLFDRGQPEHLLYIMALLNSKLLTFRFRFIGKLKSNGILEYFWNSISKLPIRRINFGVTHEVDIHDRLVSLSRQMIMLQVEISQVAPHSKVVLQRQSTVLDNQIDELVYQLYRLTNDEIEAVKRVFTV